MRTIERYGDHPSQHAELFAPDDRSAALATAVVIHGGFWRDRYDRHLMDGLCADLAGAGGRWPTSSTGGWARTAEAGR